MLSFKFRHLRILSIRILLLLGVYFLCRLIFFVYNFQSFSNSSFSDLADAFLGGVLFDLSAIIYVNLLYIILFVPTIFMSTNIVYEQILKWVYLISNFAGILFNIIDIEYYRFQKKRTGFELFSGENDIIKILPSYLKDYWWLILISVLLTVILYKYYQKTRQYSTQERKPFIALKVISTLLFLGLLIILMRGGLQTKPIQTISASQWSNPQNASLVLNTPFTIIQSIGKKTLSEKNFFQEKELDSICNINLNYKSDFLFTQKNVVVIILESFSNEYIGLLNNKELYSPFLDSLMQEGFLFENAFANGKKSNEALPSIIASIPSLMDEAYTGSVYQANEINGLPALLKTKGYSSSFFHGGFNGTMNFDAFAKKAGFDQYYGMNEYSNISDFDGNWGIYDEPFLQFFAKTLGSSPKPFFSTFFSLSSHPPFSIPEEYKLKYKSTENDKHKSFLYTDQALRKFFDYIKYKPWYSNTLFVILPDHTPDAEDKYFDTKVSYYKIPILFFDPSRDWKGRSNVIASQIDVMPSILDYLHYDKKFKSFGKSLFRDDVNRYTINYRDGVYQIIDSSYVLQYSNDEVLALYEYKSDWYLTNNLKNINLNKQMELLKYLQAFIQKFNVTLIKNLYK